MQEHSRDVLALPLLIGVTLGTTAIAVCDPVVSSERVADTYVPSEITQFAPQAVVETTFLPLPRTCPHTPAGRARWDLCTGPFPVWLNTGHPGI